METVSDQLVSPGKWDVLIEFKDQDDVNVICVNRPAITFGDRMLRIADAEFEVWVPAEAIEKISVIMKAKTTLLQLVERFGEDELRSYAKNLRADSTDEDFLVSSVLLAAADMHSDVSEFLGVGETNEISN